MLWVRIFLQIFVYVLRLPFFVLSLLSVLMLIQICSLSLAKSFMWEALQGRVVIALCEKCYICSQICHVILQCGPGHFGFTLPSLGWEMHLVIFKFLVLKMCKITLMLSDPIPPSSAIGRDRSGKGTSQEGVRENFPGLSLGPSLSSHVTVLGFSLEKPAVAILIILPGQSQSYHNMKM